MKDSNSLSTAYQVNYRTGKTDFFKHYYCLFKIFGSIEYVITDYILAFHMMEFKFMGLVVMIGSV